VIILDGELEIELDSGEWIHLAAGDVVIRRGTMHAWENNSDRNCRIAALLIGAQPVVIDGRVLEANWT
jgi:quercetin dioxygenase-like cupin family protein